MVVNMPYSQFSGSIIHEPDEEYVWPSHDSLGLQDIQAISNVAGLTYSYDSGKVTWTEGAEPVDSADHGPSRWHDDQPLQTMSLRYHGDTYEAHSEERQHLGDSALVSDDYYYYYAQNGLLSTHRFSGSAHLIQSQPSSRPMMSSFFSDVQKNPVTSGSHPQEPFSTSLTPLPFPPAPVDNPIDYVDSYPTINHDFILPNQQSTYSELSANLIYMTGQVTTGLEGKVHVVPQKERGTKRRRREKVMARVKAVDKQLKRVHGGVPLSPGSTLKKSKTERKGGRRRGPDSSEGSQMSSSIFERLKEEENGHAVPAQPTKHIPPPSGVGRTSTLSADRSSTKKKLGLACLFCRERKIACGRPSESNPDQTCNQCARRFFKCEYPIESRRGQHKRPKGKQGVA